MSTLAAGVTTGGCVGARRYHACARICVALPSRCVVPLVVTLARSDGWASCAEADGLVRQEDRRYGREEEQGAHHRLSPAAASTPPSAVPRHVPSPASRRSLMHARTACHHHASAVGPAVPWLRTGLAAAEVRTEGRRERCCVCEGAAVGTAVGERASRNAPLGVHSQAVGFRSAAGMSPGPRLGPWPPSGWSHTDGLLAPGRPGRGATVQQAVPL